MTIKEMAEKYAEEQGLRQAYNGSCDTPKYAYIIGANAVLEEIEKAVSVQVYNKYAENCCSYPSWVKDKLVSKIKELKGE